MSIGDRFLLEAVVPSKSRFKSLRKDYRMRKQVSPPLKGAMASLFADSSTHMLTVELCSPKTLVCYDSDMRSVCAFLTDTFGPRINLTNATSAHLRTFLTDFGNGHRSTSVTRKVNALRSFFKWLCGARPDVRTDNPAQELITPEIPPRTIIFLSLEQITRVLAYKKGNLSALRDGLILKIIVATGRLPSELMSLNVTHCVPHYAVRTLTVDAFSLVFNQYTEAEFRVRLPESLTPDIVEYIDKVHPRWRKKTSPNEYSERPLFLNKHGRRISDRGIRRRFGKMGERAGLKTALAPKLLRHSFIKERLINGATNEELAQALCITVGSVRVITERSREFVA